MAAILRRHIMRIDGVEAIPVEVLLREVLSGSGEVAHHEEPQVSLRH
jgi:hypothetical protein